AEDGIRAFHVTGVQTCALPISRAIILGLVIFLLLCGLAWRMAYLQITLHEKYRDLSENNRMQLRPVAPNRGLIYDRNGVLLAEKIGRASCRERGWRACGAGAGT